MVGGGTKGIFPALLAAMDVTVSAAVLFQRLPLFVATVVVRKKAIAPSDIATTAPLLRRQRHRAQEGTATGGYMRRRCLVAFGRCSQFSEETVGNARNLFFFLLSFLAHHWCGGREGRGCGFTVEWADIAAHKTNLRRLTGLCAAEKGQNTARGLCQMRWNKRRRTIRIRCDLSLCPSAAILSAEEIQRVGGDLRSLLQPPDAGAGQKATDHLLCLDDAQQRAVPLLALRDEQRCSLPTAPDGSEGKPPISGFGGAVGGVADVAVMPQRLKRREGGRRAAVAVATDDATICGGCVAVVGGLVVIAGTTRSSGSSRPHQ